jgi:hypothetical protein
MYPQARYSPSRARGSRIHPKVEVLSVIVFFVCLIRLVPWARFREGRVQGVALSATTTSGACIYVCLALFLHCQHLAVLYSQYNWVRSTRVTTSKTSGFTITKLGTLSASIWNLMLRSIHRRCTFNSIPDSSSYVGKAPSAFLEVQFQFLTTCNRKVGRDGQVLGEGFDVPESVRGVRFQSALWISNLCEFLHVT